MKNIFISLFSLFISIFLISCSDDKGHSMLLSISNKALNDTSSIYYAHFDQYPSDARRLPIGIFDSGTGGLTVLETILKIDKFDNITGKEIQDGIPDFAGENFVYLADYANFPYGNYWKFGKEDILREIVIKNSLFMMGRNFYNLSIDEKPTGYKDPVKIVIIASNAASACGYRDVDTLLNLSNTGVRVVGVINSGVRAALDSLDRNSPYSIGVLSTPGMIASGEYDKSINNISSAMGFNFPLQVFYQEGEGITDAIEGNKRYILKGATAPRGDYAGPKLGSGENDINPNLLDRYNFQFGGNEILFTKEGETFTNIQLNSLGNYARFNLVSLVEKHRKSGCLLPLSSIILGNTHYPFIMDTLKNIIKELYNFKRDGVYLYRNTISNNIRFIDPAEYTAKECYNILREAKKLALRTSGTQLSAFVSLPSYGLSPDFFNPDGSFTDIFKYGRVLGSEEVITKIVPFSSRYIDSETVLRMEHTVPLSFTLIKKTLY